MRTLARLLYSLIVLTLILNSTGSAWALAADAVSHQTLAAAVVPSNSGQADCHEQPNAADLAHGLADLYEVAAGLGDSDTPATDDGCCQSASCDCACMQQASVVMAYPAWVSNASTHGEPLRALPVRHAAPVLPDLIRPPIS